MPQEKLKDREREDQDRSERDRSRGHRDDHHSHSRRRGSSARRERGHSEAAGEDGKVKRSASREVTGEDERRTKIPRVEKADESKDVDMVDPKVSLDLPADAIRSELILTLIQEDEEPEEGEI